MRNRACIDSDFTEGILKPSRTQFLKEFLCISHSIKQLIIMNNEEKFDALFNVVTQLSLTVTKLRNARPQQPANPYQNPNTKNAKEDRTMRVDVHEFDGTSHDPETYIEWEKGVERYFEFKDTHPDHQYKIAKVKLTRLVATWLEGVQRQRT